MAGVEGPSDDADDGEDVQLDSKDGQLRRTRKRLISVHALSIILTARRNRACLEAAGMPSVMEGQSKEEKKTTIQKKEERTKTKHNAGDIISF